MVVYLYNITMLPAVMSSAPRHPRASPKGRGGTYHLQKYKKIVKNQYCSSDNYPLSPTHRCVTSPRGLGRHRGQPCHNRGLYTLLIYCSGKDNYQF